ncbi:hypothetical protein IBTHAUMO2_930010 [Nitrosopumilaceae archaeon]|nr:hypothetical protein IBTHAUMO2_930010 [Nitrosopumilaceae archaeon]
MAARPFRCSVEGVQCIAIMGPDSVVLDFVGYGERVEIAYEEIRCVREDSGMVRIEAARDDKPLAYRVRSRSAKRLHRAVIDAVRDWTA